MMNSAEVLSWLTILLPTIVPAASSLGTVYLIFKLTTEKERRDLEEKKERAATVNPSVWMQMLRLLKEARLVDDSTKFRDVEAKAKGICEYLEIATMDLYHFSSIEGFTKFTHLKRIALFFREEMIRVNLQTDGFTRETYDTPLTTALASMLSRVEERMNAYAERYM